jgi:hypothetical protein
MAYSTCCGAHTNYTEYDICPESRDHCDWEDEEDIEEREAEEAAQNQIEQDKLNRI